MKRWQKLLGMGVLLFLLLPACGLFEGAPKEKTAAQKAAEEKARWEAERRRGMREDLIASLQLALVPPADHDRTRATVQGGSLLFDDTCQNLRWIERLSHHLRAKASAIPPITWADVGVKAELEKKEEETDEEFAKRQEEAREKAVLAQYRKLGIRTAEDLLYIFSLPRSLRERAPRCQRYVATRPPLLFENGSWLMNTVEEVVAILPKGHRDLGMRALEFRGILQRDFQAEVEDIRRDRRLAPRNRRARLFAIIERAREWNFTPEDLGIRRQELEVRRVR